MPFPKTESEFKSAGYRKRNFAHCGGCGALIQWYETPKHKSMPINPDTLEPHWATCPKAKEFKK